MREGWNKNTGVKPDHTKLVDIELNCDEVDAPGIPCIRYNEEVNRWDWQTRIGGVEIIYWRFSQ